MTPPSTPAPGGAWDEAAVIETMAGAICNSIDCDLCSTTTSAKGDGAWPCDLLARTALSALAPLLAQRDAEMYLRGAEAAATEAKSWDGFDGDGLADRIADAIRALAPAPAEPSHER